MTLFNISSIRKSTGKMKYPKVLFVTVLLLILSGSCLRQNNNNDFSPADLVNPLMGTDSDFSLSHGNTYPAVAMPWGMNFWSPQTGRMNSGWFYAYNDRKIAGIRQTHQPSPWINDYAAFSFMATTKEVFSEKDRASWFSHKAETARPYYYSVYLADYDVTAEVCPSERAAILRFTFPESDSSYILLDALCGGSMVKVDKSGKTITGYCRNNHGGVPENFHNYFIARFDREIESVSVWHGDTLERGKTELKGSHTGAMLRFRTKRGEKISVKVASSFISPEQAELNLKRELGEKDFDDQVKEANDEWNRQLGRIKVEGGSDDRIRTFYSCLYRILLFPRQFHEIDAENNVVHYSPYNGKIEKGYMYTDNGFWDTFRAVFPFFTLMYPDVSRKVMDGLANTYRESGWLPEWASPGHRDCMIGSNSASLITDAWVKGIRGYNIDTLYAAIIKNTMGPGPVSSVGRLGADYYNSIGYVPYDAGINENAARTLEYAYADFCISRLARELKKPEAEIRLYEQRAMNYKNVFDPGRKLMRGRNKDGSFQSPFSPYKWGDAFTEGNSWHYTWSVFQDVAGLVDLMGGKEAFNMKLDSVFTVPPVFDCSYYGIVIHEIREMQIMNLGNYAHGNQPVQHMIYLYNYSGEPWKAQFHVRDVMKKLYNYTPDGYCGDEDNGQTSAWYVFSALGFYPVTPGTDQYVFGSPLFKKATLSLENGRKLTILARENSDDNVYVKQVSFEGKLIDRNFIRQHELMAGGRLVFKMDNKPETRRGTTEKAFPYSMSTGDRR